MKVQIARNKRGLKSICYKEEIGLFKIIYKKYGPIFRANNISLIINAITYHKIGLITKLSFQ